MLRTRMGLQDLTPQLRTRLGRVERMVGLFVSVAALLLLAGFSYYLYHTAQRKGWFLLKLPYHTFVQSAEGLKVGDPVKLMGFDVGVITEVTAMEPFSDFGNVYIQFTLKEPFYGYVWDDSKVRVSTADFLGNRSLEVIAGGGSGRTNLHASYRVEDGEVKGVWDDKAWKYAPYARGSKGYTLIADESPALSVRFENVAGQIERALPNILNLTNQLTAVLSNTTELTANFNGISREFRPVVSNLALITAQLRDPRGSLGEWLLPTNLHARLDAALESAHQTLLSADTTLLSAETNLTALVSNLNRSLDNLALITSNLNTQVQANTNILGAVSDAVIHADELVQGLKRHWLLRSAFREPRTNAPPRQPVRTRGGGLQ